MNSLNAPTGAGLLATRTRLRRVNSVRSSLPGKAAGKPVFQKEAA